MEDRDRERREDYRLRQTSIVLTIAGLVFSTVTFAIGYIIKGSSQPTINYNPTINVPRESAAAIPPFSTPAKPATNPLAPFSVPLTTPAKSR